MSQRQKGRKLALYPDSDDDEVQDNSQQKTQRATTRRRSYRLEYLLTIIVYVLFEQFMFHEWRIYDFYKQRNLDVGLFDMSNLPLTAHNYELYTLLRTEVNMTDFSRFVEVAVHDSIRDQKRIDPDDIQHLQNITEHTVFSRVQFRRYLSEYMPERMMWTGIDPVHNDTRERDNHRYYWSSKMAKDLIILSGKEQFTYSEIDSYFQDKVILNYLNLLVLESIQVFERLLIEHGEIKEAFFDEHLAIQERLVPFLRKAKRLAKFIDMNNIYFQFADIVNRNDSAIFREQLSDFEDFRTDPAHYMPVLDPAKFNNTIDSFRAKTEPYLIFEEKFDNRTDKIGRSVRRSPLSRDTGVWDVRRKYQFEQRDINNTHIMRGFHIIVRDYDGNILSDEYGSIGPFPDHPEVDGKVMWYRPHDYMNSKYREGEELEEDFVMIRPKRFKIHVFDDKRAVYFQRIKKSNFLPRCLRDLQTTHLYLKHDWLRCPKSEQEPVFDDFYERLGIERGKDYIFEFLSIW